MLRVPLNQARPGMVLAIPILHPERPDTVLVQERFVLDQMTIERLALMKHTEVWIDYPDLAFLSPCIDTQITELRGKTTRLLKDSFSKLNHETAAKLDYNAFRTTVDALIHALLDNPRAAFCMQDLCESDDALARHSSNVCFLSVLIGLKLSGYLIKERRRLPPHRARDVVSLGVAAMMHDIGMRFIEPEAQARWYRTHDTDDAEWRAHCKLGYRAIRGDVPPSSAAAVLHHHQRYDGTGFPSVRVSGEATARPLAGDEIHIFARIIACADLYERFRNPANALRATPRVAALHRMLREPESKWIDPVVMSGLLQVVPPYAPGTMVTLSDGRTAAVARWTPDAPCRPKVLLIDEREAQRHKVWAASEADFLDLRARPDLHIAEMDSQDVSSFNFEPPVLHDPRDRALLRGAGDDGHAVIGEAA